jgi:hypothetical protein
MNDPSLENREEVRALWLSHDARLVAGAVGLVVAAVLALPSVITVASPEVIPMVAVTSEVCR